MYSKIKRIVKSIFPKRVIFKYELFFRYFYYQFYKGSKYKCNICNKDLSKFVDFGEDKICPSCGSLSRNRRLWQIIDDNYLKENISILDFSPSRSLYRILKNTPLIKYISTDLSGDFFSDVSFDITNINTNAEVYDLIICYHILEHIEDDLLAMSELYRVLKTGGKCIIQTPFKIGDTYEDISIVKPEERLSHFGQEDHVRIYSVNDLHKRLTKCGFDVVINEFVEDDVNKYGFSKREYILVCSK